MADSDKSIYNLRYNQITSNLEAFGGGTPQWTLVSLNNVDPTQVPITRQINTTSPLMGGGNLTVDRTLFMPSANSSTDGYLLQADWNTFNNKQVAGAYITALTGDAIATGPGAVPLTLATVNGSVGTFTFASITVNGKGLITSASSGTFGSLTDVGTDGIIITNGTGAVAGAGTSIAQHIADASHNGYLSQADWSTFNNKLTSSLTSANIFVGNVSNIATAVPLSGDATLASTGALTLATVNGSVGSFTNANITIDAKGRITAASSGSSSGITQLTGDITAGPGSGSQAATLATVNGNVGSFTYSSITVNAKGLITAASSGVAPVTSVSGTANQITSTGGTTPVLAIANPVTFPGAMTAGGALAMAANKITGLANGTASTDAAAFGQIFMGFQAPVVASTTTNSATTSSTYQPATGLSVTITPTNAAHRILLQVSVAILSANTSNSMMVTIKRGTTDIALNTTRGFAQITGMGAGVQTVIPIVYVDSPLTTSATTYQVFFRSGDNTSDVEINGNAVTSTIIATEIV